MDLNTDLVKVVQILPMLNKHKPSTNTHVKFKENIHSFHQIFFLPTFFFKRQT